jgi:2-methylisocitrate lyase-like PEP mutase family enzyme
MTEFADLHRPGDPLFLPNAWDFASAAWLARAGFRAIGTTSLGVAAAAGIPDGLGATREPTTQLVNRLSSLPCLVTVDIEGGFSEDIGSVTGLVKELSEAGAVGVNIEDGRGNSRLADVEVQAELIAAIKAATPGVFVNARTDTYWLYPQQPDLDETIARTKAYEAAGADGIFVPGLIEYPDIVAVASATRLPLNVLFLPGRRTVSQLAALGVARISTGSLLFRAGLQAALDTAIAVRNDREPAGKLPSYQDINSLSA